MALDSLMQTYSQEELPVWRTYFFLAVDGPSGAGAGTNRSGDSVSDVDVLDKLFFTCRMPAATFDVVATLTAACHSLTTIYSSVPFGPGGRCYNTTAVSIGSVNENAATGERWQLSMDPGRQFYPRSKTRNMHGCPVRFGGDDRANKELALLRNRCDAYQGDICPMIIRMYSNTEYTRNVQRLWNAREFDHVADDSLAREAGEDYISVHFAVLAYEGIWSWRTPSNRLPVQSASASVSFCLPARLRKPESPWDVLLGEFSDGLWILIVLSLTCVTALLMLGLWRVQDTVAARVGLRVLARWRLPSEVRGQQFRAVVSQQLRLRIPQHGARAGRRPANRRELGPGSGVTDVLAALVGRGGAGARAWFQTESESPRARALAAAWLLCSLVLTASYVTAMFRAVAAPRGGRQLTLREAVEAGTPLAAPMWFFNLKANYPRDIADRVVRNGSGRGLIIRDDQDWVHFLPPAFSQRFREKQDLGLFWYTDECLAMRGDDGERLAYSVDAIGGSQRGILLTRSPFLGDLQRAGLVVEQHMRWSAPGERPRQPPPMRDFRLRLFSTGESGTDIRVFFYVLSGGWAASLAVFLLELSCRLALPRVNLRKVVVAIVIIIVVACAVALAHLWGLSLL